MGKTVIILFVCCILSWSISFIFYKLYTKKKKQLKCEKEKYEGLKSEFQKIIEIYKIKLNNKEIADEKINELHNGDAVANAVDFLRNSKGNSSN